MKWLSLLLFSILASCLPQKVVEAPIDIYIVPLEKQYKAEVVKLKPIAPPFEPEWDIEIEYRPTDKVWSFNNYSLKGEGLNVLHHEDDFECWFIKEGPRRDRYLHDMITLYCEHELQDYLSTREVGCVRGTIDTASARNEFFEIYVSCNGVR